MNLIDEINKEIEEMGIQSDTVNSPVLSDTDSTIEQVEKPKKKRGRPAKVQNEIFVEMWNAALENGSLGEVAASLGISAASCALLVLRGPRHPNSP